MTVGRVPRLLVLGAAGQLGWELCRCLPPLASVAAAARAGAGSGVATHAVDVSDAGALRRLLAEVKPAVVVNAAAYTAVDRAESEPREAQAVNAAAPGLLAEEVRRTGGLLIHYSTDYVFDGTSQRPYGEEDEPNPRNVYGASKLAGERAVAQSGVRHLILRTSWVYAARGRNFMLGMLRAARERGALRVVDDQFGAPTAARSLAEVTAQVLAQARVMGDDWLSERCGLYHAAAAGECTWYRFARAIFEQAPPVWTPGEVRPVTSAEYPSRAARPRSSRLDCRKLHANFGLALGPWEEDLARVMAEWAACVDATD
ncbi:MAG: dTDP-4-dehydrorhamnose reductase [Gammaproteobacteria bacterium]|nr:dTDP-4-dehydrorhamnose reductase [Gammaproteobacteria bacterium]